MVFWLFSMAALTAAVSVKLGNQTYVDRPDPEVLRGL
jgi:hypothetical protein